MTRLEWELLKEQKKLGMSDSNNTSSGIGFWGLLTIALIVLKLCSVITWSWWWVLFPVWVPIGLVCIFALLYAFTKR